VRRQSVVGRIDTAFLDVLEHSFRAGYLSGAKKLEAVEASLTTLDVAKFFLLVAWESNALTNSQYLNVSGLLVDASKMLVGWRTYLEKKTLAQDERK
jgi:hypothetical protein